MTIDARAVSNRHLTCDFCGLVPPMLYLPEKYAGVFCKACVGDVVRPAPVTLAADGKPDMWTLDGSSMPT